MNILRKGCSLPYTKQQYNFTIMQFDAAFAALSDPTRLAIFTRLAGTGEVDATELARRVGTRRPVRLNPARLDEIIVRSGRLRQTLMTNYDRLDALLSDKDSQP